METKNKTAIATCIRPSLGLTSVEEFGLKDLLFGMHYFTFKGDPEKKYMLPDNRRYLVRTPSI